MTKVKTITTLKFDYMQAGIGENLENVKPVKSAYAEYDPDGHVLMEISFRSDGSEEQKCVNKYDDKGKIVEELLYNEEGELDEKKTYEYDEKGNLSRELLYYLDGSFDTTSYTYDESGNLLEKTTTDPDGMLESKKVIEYKEGALLSEVTKDADGNILNEVHVEYDVKGNELVVERYNAEDDKTTRTEFIYDENGKKSEAATYSDGKLVSKQTYESNEKDQLTKIIEEELYSKSITTLEYDEKGNMIEQLDENEKGDLNSRISRKFNEHDRLSEVNVTIDRHGRGLNQNYMIQYLYEYFE